MMDLEPSVPGCYCAACIHARVLEAIELHKAAERSKPRKSKRIELSDPRLFEPLSWSW